MSLQSARLLFALAKLSASFGGRTNRGMFTRKLHRYNKNRRKMIRKNRRYNLRHK